VLQCIFTIQPCDSEDVFPLPYHEPAYLVPQHTGSLFNVLMLIIIPVLQLVTGSGLTLFFINATGVAHKRWTVRHARLTGHQLLVHECTDLVSGTGAGLLAISWKT